MRGIYTIIMYLLPLQNYILIFMRFVPKLELCRDLYTSTSVCTHVRILLYARSKAHVLRTRVWYIRLYVRESASISARRQLYAGRQQYEYRIYITGIFTRIILPRTSPRRALWKRNMVHTYVALLLRCLNHTNTPKGYITIVVSYAKNKMHTYTFSRSKKSWETSVWSVLSPFEYFSLHFLTSSCEEYAGIIFFCWMNE